MEMPRWRAAGALHSDVLVILLGFTEEQRAVLVAELVAIRGVEHVEEDVRARCAI